MTTQPWLLFSSRSIRKFEDAQIQNATNFHIYTSAWTEFPNINIQNRPCTRLSIGEDNLIEIQDHQLTVTTSSRNVTPLYWCTDDHGNFVLSTDLLIAASAWANLKDSQPIVRKDSGIYLDNRSIIYDIKRLAHSRCLKITLFDDLMHIEQTTIKDELALQSNLYDDALLAGQAQISALQQSITRHLQKNRKTAVLISGGVDSGLVAALLAEQCPCLEVFSIGTPWGNEFDDAQQLADAIGFTLKCIELDPQSILLALPQTIRAFGHTQTQSIEIGVAITAFCRQLKEGRLIFTGYGSDLINSGLATGDGLAQDIQSSIALEVNKTRYSSELTSLAAQAYGSELVHPYWDLPVLRTALDTCPSVKTARNREKGHLRLAAEQWLPVEAAWRKKTAIHHGNGLGFELAQFIDNTTGCSDSAARLYRQILIVQLEQAILTPLMPLPDEEILDRSLQLIANY